LRVATCCEQLTVEDRNLLSGHFALLLREFSLAQDLLLSSTRPLAALEVTYI
jgi:hypothetical protein